MTSGASRENITRLTDIVLTGASSEDILLAIKESETSGCSSRTLLSKLRFSVLNSDSKNKYNSTFQQKYKKLLSYKTNKNISKHDKDIIKKFTQKTPLIDIYKSLKLLRTTRDIESNEIMQVIMNIYVIKDNLMGVKLPHEDRIACKLATSKILEEKLKNVVTFTNINALIDEGMVFIKTKTLRRPADRDELIIYLLLMSGRRLVELVNTKSTFRPVKNNQYLAVFTGQAKKRKTLISEVDDGYTIPLLVPFDVFVTGMKKLHDYIKPELIQYDGNDTAISNKYSSPLSKKVNVMVKAIVKKSPAKVKVHSLRSVYVIILSAPQFFDLLGDYSYNIIAKTVLGHEGLETSINYNSSRVTLNDTEHVPQKYKNIDTIFNDQ